MKKPRPKSQRASAIKDRAAKTAQVVSPSSPVAAEAPKEQKKPFNPIQFVNEVRAEGRKITWTSRRETWITSVMVFIMVAITAVFFQVVDFGLSAAMAGIFKLASPGS
jgi:preprotein translocase subunit SecE